VEEGATLATENVPVPYQGVCIIVRLGDGPGVDRDEGRGDWFLWGKE
jgi:hypothetical protein